MFESYDYIPDTNIPCNHTPSAPVESLVKKPLAYYNAKDEFIGYSWNYGDSIMLEFNTSGEVQYNDLGVWEDAATYLQDKVMILELFDFRCDLVYKSALNSGVCVKFLLDENVSKRLVKGVYSFKLTLLDRVNNIKHTLMPSESDKCLFYVK